MQPIHPARARPFRRGFRQRDETTLIEGDDSRQKLKGSERMLLGMTQAGVIEKLLQPLPAGMPRQYAQYKSGSSAPPGEYVNLIRDH